MIGREDGRVRRNSRPAGMGRRMAVPAAALILMLAAAGRPTGAVAAEQTTGPSKDTVRESRSDWTILVYLCGSDLESTDGTASANIAEMCEADLSGDVNVIIETGGASEWHREEIDPDYLQRFRVEDGALVLADEQESASMGDAATLSDFMDWGVRSYPSERYGLVLWNHGGANAEGICYDERYDDDNLTTTELKTAMDAAPCTFDLIGFDACLTASLETAKAVDGGGRYMVASEEAEPGYGWDYRSFLNTFSEDSSMKGDELGRVVCDSFLAKCEDYDCEDQATMSVLDLSRVEKLNLAFDEYSGSMALAAEDVETLRSVASGADKAESYGGNTESEGYCNMVDMADLVNHTRDYLDNDGSALLSAIEETVVYEVHGSSRGNSAGIAIFYPLSVSREEVESYAEMSDNTPYLQYIAAVTDTYDMVDWESQWEENYSLAEALASLQESLASLNPVTDDDFDIEYEQYFDEDNLLTFRITSGQDAVKSVHFLLYYEPDGSGTDDPTEYVFLGEDNNLDADYDAGIFRDNFYGAWMTIGGEYVSAELIEETDHYNLYSIPAQVNGKETNIRAVYSHSTGEYRVLGSYDGLYEEDSDSRTSRGIRPLEDGDEVVFLLPYYNRESDEEGSYVTDPVTWSGDVVMEDAELGDGFFLYMFEAEDLFGNEYDSDPVEMQVAGDSIQPYENAG